MNKNKEMVAVLVLVVIVLVGWFAYKQGYLGGMEDNKQDIELDLPGINSSPQPQQDY